MKLNWNFLGDGGAKKPSVGEYGYFLELHITVYSFTYLLIFLGPLRQFHPLEFPIPSMEGVGEWLFSARTTQS